MKTKPVENSMLSTEAGKIVLKLLNGLSTEFTTSRQEELEVFENNLKMVLAIEMEATKIERHDAEEREIMYAKEEED